MTRTGSILVSLQFYEGAFFTGKSLTAGGGNSNNGNVFALILFKLS